MKLKGLIVSLLILFIYSNAYALSDNVYFLKPTDPFVIDQQLIPLMLIRHSRIIDPEAKEDISLILGQGYPRGANWKISTPEDHRLFVIAQLKRIIIETQELIQKYALNTAPKTVEEKVDSRKVNLQKLEIWRLCSRAMVQYSKTHTSKNLKERARLNLFEDLDTLSYHLFNNIINTSQFMMQIVFLKSGYILGKRNSSRLGFGYSELDFNTHASDTKNEYPYLLKRLITETEKLLFMENKLRHLEAKQTNPAEKDRAICKSC